jgi:hypothetical protein
MCVRQSKAGRPLQRLRKSAGNAALGAEALVCTEASNPAPAPQTHQRAALSSPTNPRARAMTNTIDTDANKAPRLTNSLTVLAENVRTAMNASASAEKTAIMAALEAGRLLSQAKAECPHGTWLPFLARAGVPERKAQRYMKLASSGLKSDTVSDLGGIKATLRWCDQLRLPDADEYLLISLENFASPITKPFASVWKEERGHQFCVFNTEAGWFDELTRPIIKPEFVLPSVYSALGHRFREMTFCVVKRTPDHEWLRELFDEEEATEIEAKIIRAAR